MNGDGGGNGRGCGSSNDSSGGSGGGGSSGGGGGGGGEVGYTPSGAARPPSREPRAPSSPRVGTVLSPRRAGADGPHDSDDRG